MILNRVLLFVAAAFMGITMQRMNLPIPFLLGGMVTAILCKTFARRVEVTWPKKLRELGLLVIGYGIGSNFTQSALDNIIAELVGVTEATVVILFASFLLAYATYKISGEDFKSCILGMTPGGMTLAILLCDDDKEVNPNVVMVMQVIRLFGVVITVPFLVIYLLDAQVLASSIALPSHGGIHWGCFLPLAILGSFVSRKIHLPTPNLLGPILATAIFSIMTGGLQAVPGWLMAAAQLSFGLFMGMGMDAERIMCTKKIVPFILIGTAILLVVSVGMANLLSARYGFSLVTAFLAMAPGGITEMCLAGLSMGENVAVILTYQLARLFAINLLVPPFINWYFGNRSR